MKNRKIYFHIGFGKTGSSSLQSFLSYNPALTFLDTQEKILYCCFNNDGSIRSGSDLTKKAANTPLNYVSSYPKIALIPSLSKTKDELEKIFSAGYIPFFSQEDWGRRSSEFKNANFFSELGCSAHVIVYVRPQVEWFNSAWWQWFVWYKEFSTPDDVIGTWGYNFMLWADQIAKWRNLPGVEIVNVRLHPQDIIEDFMSLLRLQKNPSISYPERTNASLNPTLIKLLLRFPEIRGIHNAEVDIILSKLLKFDDKVPWVIEKELIGKIISATHDDNLKILSMLDEQSKKVMENDPRWWNPDFYATRPLFTKADFELDKQELLAIVDQAIPALIKLQLRGSDAKLDSQITRLNQALVERDAALKQMLHSTSWRLTRPIRLLRHLVERLQHTIKPRSRS